MPPSSASSIPSRSRRRTEPCNSPASSATSCRASRTPPDRPRSCSSPAASRPTASPRAARWWRSTRSAPASASTCSSSAVAKRRFRSTRTNRRPMPRSSGSWIIGMCRDGEAGLNALRYRRRQPEAASGPVAQGFSPAREARESHMQIGRVVGTVVSTQKNRSWKGRSCCSCSRSRSMTSRGARRAGDRLGRRRRRGESAGRHRRQGGGRRARAEDVRRWTRRSSASSIRWTTATRHERRDPARDDPAVDRQAPAQWRHAAGRPPPCAAAAVCRHPATSATRCPSRAARASSSRRSPCNHCGYCQSHGY
jgi:hypothetical protein